MQTVHFQSICPAETLKYTLFIDVEKKIAINCQLKLIQSNGAKSVYELKENHIHLVCLIGF